MNEDKGRRKHGLLEIILRFLKIGLIGFGGGSALIPVFERELRGFGPKAGKEELEKNVVAASITPGALPVEIASGIGEATFGVVGMVLGGFCLALPGVFFTVLISCFFSEGSKQIVSVISAIAVVINLFILYIIVKYVVRVITGFDKNRRIFALLMALAVFFLTSGKEVRMLFHIAGDPIFDVSTIVVLMVAFFIILFTEGHVLRYRTILGVVISIVYILGESERGIFPKLVLWTVEGLMIVLAAWGLVHAVATAKQKEKPAKGRMKKIIKQEVIWIVVLFLFCLPTFFVGSTSVQYILRGIWSSFMSFGGGDAYLTIADGIFVNSGMVDSTVFYRQIVPVANALPGSILCKILTGIGYYVGYGISGSVGEGLLFALAGLGISVSASCSVFILMRHIYESFENLYIFRFLKRWIGTIIAGLLMTVAVTILQDSVAFIVGW